MLIDLYRQGRLDLDRFVSETIALDDVEEAFHKMERARCSAASSCSERDDVPIELVTTDGIFALDGGSWDVTNNIWLVGDDREVVVFDAAHDHQPIVDAVNGRRVRAIVLTHGHNDHINAAVPLRDAVDAPILLHPADRMLWDVVWPDDAPDGDVDARTTSIAVGGHELARAAHARATRPAAAASTTPAPATCSPATRCSAAGRAPPAAATATSRRSCARSSPRC